jgi:REP-associated tyrosine transposase
MSPIKRTRHAVYDLKYHFVWTPKYRKQLLKGDVAEFMETTLRRIAEEYEWEIDELAVQADHVHVFMHVAPRYAPAQVVQIMKSISAREAFEAFPQLRKQLWAGEFWGAGYFVRSVGDAVTAEVIRNYIRYQETDHDAGQLSLWD